MKGGWVYIVADRYRGGTYIGVTASLTHRIYQHRIGRGSRYAAKHNRNRLVYAERHERIEDAIAREKAMKKWLRAWKFGLIEKDNRDWLDLFETING